MIGYPFGRPRYSTAWQLTNFTYTEFEEDEYNAWILKSGNLYLNHASVRFW